MEEHLDLQSESENAGVELRDPAAEEAILTVERRLGLHLPPTYRQFLKISNGLSLRDDLYGPLLRVGDIGFYRDLSPDLITAWQSTASSESLVTDNLYFVYGDQQDTINIRTRYLSTAIQISEAFDGMVMLLVPEVRFGDELECWELASWYPGAARYRSFGEWLKSMNE